LESVHLQHVNSVHCKIVTDTSILMELADHFTFFAENYRFSPKYKSRMWDGKIRLVNRLSATVYAGLARHIKKFCDERGYRFSYDPEFQYDNVSVKEVMDFIETLNLPARFTPRDYQIKSIVKCLRSKRRTLLSPTSSGKSLMIYVVMRWYQQFGHKGLIIVPTIGLVSQMANDFKDYGYTGTMHLSTDKLSKSNAIEEDMVITTWQSMDNGKTKMPKQWYQQFEVVVERIVVDDGAVITEGQVKQVQRGATLLAMGVGELAGAPVSESDLFLTTAQLVTVWPSDPDGKLVGEDIYFGHDPFKNVERITRADLPDYYQL